MTKKNQPELEEAYGLETPDDNIALYSKWSNSYDTGFAVDMDYQLPRNVASIFMELTNGSGPVLDVGAGTGLLAECLGKTFTAEIDALDISKEMLAVATAKALYRETIVGDLTRSLDLPSLTYRAIVSSGTFTHGHVGPSGLDELLRIAARDALFVLSVNAEHYVAEGFRDKFASLESEIRNFEIRTVRNFGDKADSEHRNDLGNVVVFWKR